MKHTFVFPCIFLSFYVLLLMSHRTLVSDTSLHDIINTVNIQDTCSHIGLLDKIICIIAVFF